MPLKIVLPLTALLALSAACASSDDARTEPQPEHPLVEHPGIARHFAEAGVTGTFVLHDPAAGRALVHDADRARRRFVPASTFKVLNSLVALETGAVADTAAVFRWDGVEREVPPWNGDHTLATAFENSVVWVYQDLARRVGEGTMRDYVRRVGYGNADVGGGIDRFWLTGDLRVSPLEQVGFLRRLHERRLPFSDRTVDLVEGILVEDRGPGHVLRAKTGWARWDPVDVGWYVGCVERADRTVYFALNMDVERPEQGPARRAVARAVLADLGLL